MKFLIINEKVWPVNTYYQCIVKIKPQKTHSKDKTGNDEIGEGR